MNGPFQLEEVYANSSCDKLGIINQSTFAFLSELGRHPMSFSIVYQILIYWHILENLNGTYLLLNAAFSVSKSFF